MIDRLKSFLDCLYGGAWPFLVRGVVCLVDSVNERDLSILTTSLERFLTAFVCPKPMTGTLGYLLLR